MKIAHIVCTDAFAGVERYVAEVARQQSRAGCEVAVVGGSPSAMPSAIGDESVVWRPARSVLMAQRWLLGADVDVLHTHMTDADTAAATTKPFHRSPIVSTLHFAKPRGRDRLRSKVSQAAARFIDAQIAISEFVAERAGVECEVVLNGVGWQLPPSEREPVVLMAQRQEPEKDSATALRAWATSRLGRSGWRLEVAGDGSEHLALVQLAASLGVADSVNFLGFVSDARERIARSSVFLATAPEEPFGLSVVEAMAAATPIVASDGGAHPETVGRVSSIGLYPPGDVEACASRLRELADDPDLRASYGAQLHEEWATRFTIEEHCRRLDQIYERVLERRRRTAR